MARAGSFLHVFVDAPRATRRNTFARSTRVKCSDDRADFVRLVGEVKPTGRGVPNEEKRREKNHKQELDEREAYREFEDLLQGKRGLGSLSRADENPPRNLTAASRPKTNVHVKPKKESEKDKRNKQKDAKPLPKLENAPEKRASSAMVDAGATDEAVPPVETPIARTPKDERAQKASRRTSKASEKPPTVERPALPPQQLEIDSQKDPVQQPSQVGTLTVEKLDMEYEVEKSYEMAENLLQKKEKFQGKVFGANAGGVLIKIGAVSAFLPYSQLSKQHVEKVKEADAELVRNGDVHGQNVEDEEVANKARKREALSSLIGVEVEAAVILVDREKKKIVLSERGPSVSRYQKKEEVMKKLVVGENVEVVVTNLVEYGAFVDLEGVTAFAHINEISWDKISHPGEVLTVGEKVMAKVLNLDFDRKRISLSIRRTMPDPLEQTLQQLAADSEVTIESSVAGEESIIPALNTVVQKLRSYREIADILVGRKIHGPAFSPDFQLFIAAEGVKNGHKLVARHENDVQEVIIKTSMSRDSMVSIVKVVIE